MRPIISITLGVISLALPFGFTTATHAATYYTAQPGDTLSSIAQEADESLAQLLTDNHLTEQSPLKIGQRIILNTSNSHHSNKSGNKQLRAAKFITNLNDDDEQAAKEWIAQRESGGSYTIQNGQQYGKYQLNRAYLKGDLSPENQDRVADEYVQQRYGSWQQAKQFFLQNNWY